MKVQNIEPCGNAKNKQESSAHTFANFQMAKASANLRSLARSHTEMGLRILCDIAENSENDGARVRAIELIWDRGWGKAPATFLDDDGSQLSIIVRHIVESRSSADQAPRIIDQTPRCVTDDER